jgi:hypothetical protein
MDSGGMAGWRSGIMLQYSVKQKVTDAVEERTGTSRRRLVGGTVLGGDILVQSQKCGLGLFGIGIGKGRRIEDLAEGFRRISPGSGVLES